MFLLKKTFILRGIYCCLLFPSFSVLACTVDLSINTAITPVTLDIIKKSLILANKENCSSILMRINTPGGSLSATRLIVQEILNSPLPFLCLIDPKGAQATSAGAIILQACHVNGALRGTNLGASTPVLLGKQMEKEGDLRKKAINDTVSFVQSIVNLRNRNKKFGEEIVTEAKSVTAQEALRIHAIDFVGDTAKEFLMFSQNQTVELKEGEKIQVQVGILKKFPLGFRYNVLNFFADPQILYILFLGGIMLLYFEITHPGGLVSGVVGGIALMIALVGLNALSVAWGAVAMIFLGLILFFVEMLVPSFGVLGVGGFVSFVLGSLYLFDPVEMGDYRLPLSLIFVVSICVGSLMFGACYLAIKTLRMKKNLTAMGTVLGQKGEVTKILDDFGKTGWMMIHGETWKFRSETSLKFGDCVQVVKYEKMDLIVEKIS